MFDEQNPATVGQNPNEPEDILAPMDGAIEPGELKSALAYNKLKPVAKTSDDLPEPPSDIPPLEPRAEISQPLLSKKGFIIAVVGVVAIALLIGVIWVVVRLPKQASVVAPTPVVVPVAQPEIIPSPEPVVAPAPEEAVTPPVEAPAPIITVEPTADTDNDGLTDTEEATAGTNAQVADTDADGLSDYEEITLWKTNPLNPDTDGDGYSDGQEVKNGYNPNGAGKLLELPK
ncbi:MAG: hypothetical protein HY980_00435 [Candidatus Magasanikbacteria bacterium]|nr:hypothetical protein [Candidatus Magasanikbacteria bacterium]